MSTAIKVKLLNKKQVKEYTLAVAQARAHKFTRVGGEFYLTCETNLKLFIQHYVRRLPSKGKTIV